MDDRCFAFSAVLVAVTVLTLSISTPMGGETAPDGEPAWNPPRLADGQPDIRGTWNNVGAAHIPLQTQSDGVGRPRAAHDMPVFELDGALCG